MFFIVINVLFLKNESHSYEKFYNAFSVVIIRRKGIMESTRLHSMKRLGIVFYIKASQNEKTAGNGR